MEQYSTTAGDRIRVEWGDGRAVEGNLTLTVRRDSAASMADGVLTTATHADVLHALFRDGTTFRIRLTPADGTAETTFEGCTLLSSSGKWAASR